MNFGSRIVRVLEMCAKNAGELLLWMAMVQCPEKCIIWQSKVNVKAQQAAFINGTGHSFQKNVLYGSRQ